MTVQPPHLCISCTRYHEVPPALRVAETCDAYPDGIPADILLGSAHTVPRGDEFQQLVYQKDPERQFAYDAWAMIQEVNPQI